MAKVEAQISEGMRHPNVIQTFHTHRAVLTQEWIDEMMALESPLGLEVRDDGYCSLSFFLRGVSKTSFTVSRMPSPRRTAASCRC